MNTTQRHKIEKVLERCESISHELEGLADKLTDLSTEEQDTFDRLSEGLQQAERGENMEHAARVLYDAATFLTNAESEIEAACKEMKSAM